MNRQKQVLCTINGNFEKHPTLEYVRTSVVACPYCGKPTEVWTPKKLGLEFAPAGCEHSCGVVDAGGLMSAVHFVSRL